MRAVSRLAHDSSGCVAEQVDAVLAGAFGGPQSLVGSLDE
jgi:hypothetical protein